MTSSPPSISSTPSTTQTQPAAGFVPLLDVGSLPPFNPPFAYGQKEPIEVIGTFVSEIVRGANGKTCVDEFTVVKGPGRSLLGRSTAEK